MINLHLAVTPERPGNGRRNLGEHECNQAACFPALVNYNSVTASVLRGCARVSALCRPLVSHIFAIEGSRSASNKPRCGAQCGGPPVCANENS